MAIEVTARDTENDGTGVRILEGDDYCLITSGRMYLASTGRYPNGSIQLIIKLDEED